ncbi:glycoside hydrolase family 26 protein [Paenibacillus andongensis]|uniref:glycoside hydrolase family 26 protein n=1 Tax=Paenibacillus andongensis TaxID=2975482 RepID=UPI0021BB424D|nr:glycoside hydrolase family 26 protein [Paenibacillus andongensis]
MKQRITYVLLLSMCFALLSSSIVSAHTVSTSNSSANPKTKEVYNWLAHLPNRTTDKIASGYFGGYSNSGFSTTQLEELKSATGQYPAIFGCDYGSGWATASDPTTLIDYSCNSTLKTYWSNGGLITLNTHFPTPGAANGGGLNTKLTNFSDLLNPTTDTGKRWRTYLDKVAAGLADLQNAGVIVLWRPLHEMNGDWFWWGNQDATTFKNVWIDMYNYFKNTKGLNNLIWVYAPDFSRGNRTSYYPGSNYVDIVGLDAYDDNPEVNVTGYDELTALGKPFALAEIGPDTLGTFDYTKWMSAIKNKFPKAVYFYAWNDDWSPHRNVNGSNLMNDAWVVNRGEINLSSLTESGSGSTVTPKVLYNFEGTAESWTGTNLTGGPWSVTDWKTSGSYSLKADVNLSASSKKYTLNRAATHNLSGGYTTLKARVSHASWGTIGSGMTGKLYVKTGSTYTWVDGGTISINSSSVTTLSLPLSSVTHLTDVREIGIEFTGASNGSGSTAVYVDQITLE